MKKFIDDKVEQIMTGCQIRASQCQDVALQPPGKRPKVLSEMMRPCIEGTQFGKPGVACSSQRRVTGSENSALSTSSVCAGEKSSSGAALALCICP